MSQIYKGLSQMIPFPSDVGQARPTLHATLMQRMTDVLSRMLNDPNSRAPAQRTTSESESSQGQLIPDAATDEEGNTTEGVGGEDSGGGGPSQSSAVLGVCLAGSSTEPTETPGTVADECSGSGQLLTTSQGATTHHSEELGSEMNCDESEVNTSAMQQPVQTSTLHLPGSSEPLQESGITGNVNSTMDDTEDVSPVVEGRNHEKETPPRNSSDIEGLQDRITSLTQGFVEK